LNDEIKKDLGQPANPTTMDTGLGYSRESKVKKKTWRSIPKQLNVKEWNWKKIFKKRLKEEKKKGEKKHKDLLKNQILKDEIENKLIL